MSEITRSWSLVAAWLEAHGAPPLVPASEDAIARAESEVGRALPADVAESVRCQDGEIGGLLPIDLLPLSHAIKTPVAPADWPLAHLPDGYIAVLDGAGQVVVLRDGPREVIAPSLGALLAAGAERLKGGALGWDSVFGNVVAADDVPDTVSVAETVRRATGTDPGPILGGIQDNISARLLAGETVHVPGIGRFRCLVRRAFETPIPEGSTLVHPGLRRIVNVRCSDLKDRLYGEPARDPSIQPGSPSNPDPTLLRDIVDTVVASLTRGKPILWPMLGVFSVARSALPEGLHQPPVVFWPVAQLTDSLNVNPAP